MKKKIASVIGLILLISSCSKTHTYEIVVKNDTNYLLEEVSFGFPDDNKIITILPNDKTHTFSLSHKNERTTIQGGFGGPGHLLCGIKKWSDSTDVFTSTEDYDASFLSSDLGTVETNYFTIKLSSDTTFEITLDYDYYE